MEDDETGIFGGTLTDAVAPASRFRSSSDCGHPHASGWSRQRKLMHCPAYGPLVKHSSPIGTAPVNGVQVASVADVVEVGVGSGVAAARDTTMGPQSGSSRGQGDAARGVSGMQP